MVSSLLCLLNQVDWRSGAEPSQGEPGGLDSFMTNVILGITPYSADGWVINGQHLVPQNTRFCRVLQVGCANAHVSM